MDIKIGDVLRIERDTVFFIVLNREGKRLKNELIKVKTLSNIGGKFVGEFLNPEFKDCGWVGSFDDYRSCKGYHEFVIGADSFAKVNAYNFESEE